MVLETRGDRAALVELEKAASTRTKTRRLVKEVLHTRARLPPLGPRRRLYALVDGGTTPPARSWS